MSESILIKGGCGFIGANLVPYLRSKDYNIRVLDNLSRGHREFIADENVEVIKGDIRDKQAVTEAVEGIDYIIHLAAYGSVVESISDPFTNFDINALGTLQVLEAANQANVKKFIFASTGGALIGDAEPPVNENSTPRPKSPYGASKLVGEGYCCAYAGSFGLSTVMLRFGNIYGNISAHKKGAITVFCKSLMLDEALYIFGDGKASRDFLHVNDLCHGIFQALSSDLAPGTALHLATSRETTVNELADILRKAAGKPEHPIIYKEQRAGEVLRNFAACEKAEKLIGFKPQINLEDGLQQTWEWYLSQGDKVHEITTTDS